MVWLLPRFCSIVVDLDCTMGLDGFVSMGTRTLHWCILDECVGLVIIHIAAMQDVSATGTTIIYELEPLWGAGFAWFLLGEKWGAAGWIGAALVLGGLTVFDSVSQSFNNNNKNNSKEYKEEL